MLNIFLIRHGETSWNADNNRYCGRTDIALTPKGVQQAHALREQLEEIALDAVFSSPLQRALTTAMIAGGKEVTTDNRLIEADFGQWEGKTKEEFLQENEKLWTGWMADPATNRAGGTGETGTEIVQRMNDFFTGLQQKFKEGNILVAAHNGVNRLYLSYKLGMPLSNYRRLWMENSSLTMFTLDESGGFQLMKLNSAG